MSPAAAITEGEEKTPDPEVVVGRLVDGRVGHGVQKWVGGEIVLINTANPKPLSQTLCEPLAVASVDVGKGWFPSADNTICPTCGRGEDCKCKKPISLAASL